MGSGREDKWSVEVLVRRGQERFFKTLTLTEEQYRVFSRFVEQFPDGGDPPPVRAPAAADQPTKVIRRGELKPPTPYRGPSP
jgi:hypothetical protein